MGPHSVVFPHTEDRCPGCMLRMNVRHLMEEVERGGVENWAGFGELFRELGELTPMMFESNDGTCLDYQERIRRAIAARVPEEQLILRSRTAFMIWLHLGMYLGTIGIELKARTQESGAVDDLLREIGS